MSPAHSLHSSNDEQSLEQQPTSPETIGTSSHERSVGVVFRIIDVEDDVEDVVVDDNLGVVPTELSVVAISVVDIKGIVVVVDGGVGVVAADVGDVAIDVVNGNNVVVVAGITVANVVVAAVAGENVVVDDVAVDGDGDVAGIVVNIVVVTAKEIVGVGLGIDSVDIKSSFDELPQIIAAKNEICSFSVLVQSIIISRYLKQLL